MLIEQLKNIVGPKGWTTDSIDLEPKLTDWRGTVSGTTPIVVSPATTEEVAAIVRACAESKVGLVPQGGNTGMCAGAIPDKSGTQILLCLARMNTIRDIDTINYSMEVEAGCILQDVQNAARDVDRLFALSLGAEGSCQIGGNLSTNAGGVNVVRYGNARAQVLGLEAVLADGTIVSSLRSLRKDTAGYDLKQLFIGSEGTLGIITAATLKLFPLPGAKTTVMIALQSSGQAVRLLSYLRSKIGDRIEAFELVSSFVFGLIKKHIPDSKQPFDDDSPWYVLADFAGVAEEELQQALMTAMQAELVIDVVIAKNAAEAAGMWHLRHSISESERAEGEALKHDISVPISRFEEFLTRGDSLLAERFPEGQLIAFGHVGDGNLHYNVALPPGFKRHQEVTEAIYTLLLEVGGSISAEHGIGMVKREYLPKYRNSGEIKLMRTLKQSLDPDNILNPGKVI
jgi:FAD/FMN-containing dehydrogenase